MTDVSTLINSFEKWPVSYINKNDLVNEGFIYTGTDDHVKCVHCNIEIGMWEEGDDPHQEHLRLSPNCPSVNPTEGYDTDAFGPQDGPPSRSSKYTTYAARLESFKDWQYSTIQQPENLAAAGFYYFGMDDKVMCFSCGIGLHEWKVTDDPWEEHILWSRRCGFVRCNKDTAYIDHVLEKNSEKKRVKVNGSSEIRAKATETTTFEVTGSTTLCGICYSAEKSVAYQPCGHVFACEVCDSRLTDCPICRQQISSRIKVYIS